MFSFLKDHPFDVEAFFESSLVLAYAYPQEVVRPLVPAFLELDTFEDRYAFIAAAMVQTKGLRPKGSPSFMGADFFLIGYRVFVRFTRSDGKRIRGLYILGSRTNSRRMEFFGNIFTHYRYSTIDVLTANSNGILTILSEKEDMLVRCTTVDDDHPLPPSSPFKNWKEARRFAGPLPFTFTEAAKKDRILIIEGVRQNWSPRPVNVLEHHFGFIDKLGIGPGELANAFLVENVPYSWRRGRFEKIPHR